MFPEAPPKRRYRICLHCRRSFDSSSAAERVCALCRRKHNKLLDRHGGVVTFESTDQMKLHLDRVTEITEIDNMLSTDKVDAFLNGKDIDDSAVYKMINSKKTVSRPKKSEAVLLLESVIKDVSDGKRRKVSIYYW